jgi:hypothetical protein
MRSLMPARARLLARVTSPGLLASGRSWLPCATRRPAAETSCSSFPVCSTPWARRSDRTCRPTSCRHSRRSWRRSRTGTSSAPSSGSRWSIQGRRATATHRSRTWRPSGWSGRASSRCPALRRQAGRPRNRSTPYSAPGAPQRSGGASQRSKRASSSFRSASTLSRPRCRAEMNPSSTALSSHATSGAQ